MAAKGPLKVNLFIERDDTVEEFNGFTDEEKAAMSKELSRTLSKYYSLHPEEYAVI